jgi:N6-adenosine-specific RNA methylase IME4
VTDLLSRTRELLSEGKGDRLVARLLSEESGTHVTRQSVRRIEREMLRAGAPDLTGNKPPLALYETARKALEAATRVDEVLEVRDETEWLKLYARQAKDRDLLANATVLKVRAERRLGEMMAMAAAAGDLPEGRPRTNGSGSNPFPRATLEEAGITKSLADTARKAAAMPPAVFDARLTALREKIAFGGATIVVDATKPDSEERRESRRAEMRDLAANPMLLPAGPFAAGIADPAWEDENAPIGQTGRHYRDHYATMTPRQIADFTDGEGRKPADIFAPTAFLGLWVTDHILVHGLHLPVLEAWNFKPCSLICWDKLAIGMGQGFTRNRTEHLILAKRGLPAAPGAPDRVDSLLTEQRTTRHSQKPLTPLEWIERWFPDMSYVYLFPGDDSTRPNWCMWGKPHRQTEAAE